MNHALNKVNATALLGNQPYSVVSLAAAVL